MILPLLGMDEWKTQNAMETRRKTNIEDIIIRRGFEAGHSFSKGEKQKTCSFIR